MLYIFDKDWTICQPKEAGERFINSTEQQILMPRVAEKCAKLQQQGHALAVASNQGGVAWGFMSEADAEALVAHAAGLIQADAWTVCPHHRKGRIAEYAIECDCRKPQPGMIFRLMKELDYNADEVVFVGDMESDCLAAKAAGVKFVWADKFFKE